MNEILRVIESKVLIIEKRRVTRERYIKFKILLIRGVVGGIPTR